MDKLEIDRNIDQSFVTLQSGKIYQTVINDVERILIQKALEKSRGNQILAARILGLNRNTIRTKIRKLRINMESFK